MTKRTFFKNVIVTCSVLVVLLPQQLYGQLAIINNSKEHVDVRSDTLDNSKILGRVFVDDIFWDGIQPYDTATWDFIIYSPEMNNLETDKRAYYKEFLKNHSWTNFQWDDKGNLSYTYSKSNNVKIEGYIHQEEVKSIDELDAIKHKIVEKNKILFWDDSIRIEIEIVPFDKSKHKMEIDKQFHYATKVDGRKPIMVDMIPLREFTKFEISIHGKNIVIPKSQYKDIYDCELKDLGVYLDKNSGIYIYKVDSSDGGGFAVAWLIKNGKYLKRYIDGNG